MEGIRLITAVLSGRKVKAVVKGQKGGRKGEGLTSFNSRVPNFRKRTGEIKPHGVCKIGSLNLWEIEERRTGGGK